MIAQVEFTYKILKIPALPGLGERSQGFLFKVNNQLSGKKVSGRC